MLMSFDFGVDSSVLLFCLIIPQSANERQNCGNYILQNEQNARNVQNNNCPLLRCRGKTPETNKCFINERYTSYIYLIGFIDFAYNLV